MYCHFTLMNKLNVKHNGNMFGIRVVCAECFMVWNGCMYEEDACLWYYGLFM